jgi:glycine cleavage system H protein
MRFTKDHEWIVLKDGVATAGITAHAADLLGDIVFVELPEIGATLKSGDGMAVVESVKAASDVFAPITGEVVEANTALADHPELINQDPEGAAWIVRIRPADPTQIETLMDREAYRALTERR